MCRSITDAFTERQGASTGLGVESNLSNPTSPAGVQNPDSLAKLLLTTGGKPSTWLPPGGLVEQSTLTATPTTISTRDKEIENAQPTEKGAKTQTK